jgi:hypothetical protein
MTRGRETIDVAQLRFVGLSDVQQAYGDRWPPQRARIQDAAEAFLQHRLGASDFVIRGDNGFLVVLDTAAGAEAHAIVAQLAHGLNAFFLGEDQHGFPRVSGVAQTVTARDLEASIGRLNAAPDVRQSPADLSDLPELDWRYEPVWDVKHEILSSWHVTPVLRSTGARLSGYQFEPAPTAPSRLLKVDEANLWVAELALKSLLATRNPTLVGARLHAGTLVNLGWRARILATIDRLDPQLHRYRLIKLAGVAPGFPRIYLNELVGMLKAKLPNIVIGASWNEPDVAGLLQTGPSAVSFAVPPSAVAPGSVIALPALITKITAAIRLAHAHRARVLVEGAVTKLLALRLAAAGVDNIASNSIWPAHAEPAGMLKWTADRLAAA